jgi:polyisoprenoid-binding protein YceI
MSNDSRPAVIDLPGYAAATWRLDPSRSEATFTVRQMGGKVRGRVTRFDATIVTTLDPAESSVTATLDLASIDTGNTRRDEHLRTATFLDAATHPRANYRSNAVRRTDDGAWEIDGHLVLHGVTRRVPLRVTAARFAGGPDDALRYVTFSATAVVNRADFGISRWGGVIGRTVVIDLTITAVR